jgi:hypothetical protein
MVTWSLPFKLHCSLVGASPFAGFCRTPRARLRNSSVRLLATLFSRLVSAMDYQQLVYLTVVLYLLR